MIQDNGSIEEVSSRTSRFRMAFGNLQYLCERRDVGLEIKAHVRNMGVPIALQNGCETRSLRTADGLRSLMSSTHSTRAVGAVC